MSRKPRKEPVFDHDNPEWTEADFARAIRHKPGPTLLEAAEEVRRRGRPPAATKKEAISLRLDADVLAAYRARFADDPAAINLSNWQAFEADNPDTFAGMYQFWVQKPA